METEAVYNSIIYQEVVGRLLFYFVALEMDFGEQILCKDLSCFDYQQAFLSY
jgi:hypothetical protein